MNFGRGSDTCSLAYRGGVEQRYKFPVTEAFCPFRRGLLFKGKQQLKFTVLLLLLFLAANVAAYNIAHRDIYVSFLPVVCTAGALQKSCHPGK